MKKLIFILLVSLASKGFSQCTNVCVVGTVSVTGGGGGGGNRQSTQDSINHALYYSGVGQSTANLINTSNSNLGQIVGNTTGISFYRQSTVDSLLHLFYAGSTNLINEIDVYTVLSYSKLIDINNNTSFTGNNLLDGSGHKSLTDGSNQSVFLAANNESYLNNTKPIDTLFTNTNYANLVSALNAFYNNPYHLNSRILQESHTNAVVTATLTYYCVVRFKQ